MHWGKIQLASGGKSCSFWCASMNACEVKSSPWTSILYDLCGGCHCSEYGSKWKYLQHIGSMCCSWIMEISKGKTPRWCSPSGLDFHSDEKREQDKCFCIPSHHPSTLPNSAVQEPFGHPVHGQSLSSWCATYPQIGNLHLQLHWEDLWTFFWLLCSVWRSGPQNCSRTKDWIRLELFRTGLQF